jgi:predicted metalloprotease with PDZ domain
VGDLIASIERTPGRLVQALSNASYDAWIKAYRPDENSVNVLFSYYSGGALAALLLDAEIRRVSNGASSLDDVMRAGYHRFSGERGYTEEEFIALVGEVTGHDLSAWIRGSCRHPAGGTTTPMLDWYGLAFETPPAGQATLPNGLEPPDPPRGWLGADTTVKNGAGRHRRAHRHPRRCRRPLRR